MPSVALLLCLLAGQASDPLVGSSSASGLRVATGQFLQPAGHSVQIPSRPVDLAVRNGRAYLKDNRGITVIDTKSRVAIGVVPLTGGTSLFGLAWTEEGHLLASGATGNVFRIDPASRKVADTIAMPTASVGGPAYPCGIATQGGTAYVALSRANSLAIVDLATKRVRTISVDLAPFGVALSGDLALVTCWSRKVQGFEPTQKSAGTPMPIVGGGRGAGGTVALVDLKRGKQIASIPVGLQPSEIVVRQGMAYVANANSDTVSVIDIARRRVARTLTIKPDSRLPFGSAPNALEFGPDGRLYVACGGNNAVAVLSTTGAIEGWIPTGWYPTALAWSENSLLIGNAKGIGSRNPPANRNGRNVYDFTGTMQIVPRPLDRLAQSTAKVMALVNAPQTLRTLQRSQAKVAPVPVPRRLGEPSVFEHVVYILKENRTYDEVFADLTKGDREPSLLLFPRRVTPNHHALAEQFVLLDNFYCNGVLSADGHAWAMEGNASSYFERAFGGWTRSYPFGDDPLAVSSSGYVWDAVLAQGLSFRNYGEFNYAEPVPANATFKQIYDDWLLPVDQRKIKFTHNIGVSRLRAYSNLNYPGWNMRIPDVLRAEVFIEDLKRYEEEGNFPNFTIVYLPQDHASGLTPGMPTPNAHLADNDLALGRVVEAISRSKFWPKTVIFSVEDDPQAGLDHVDGHRTIGLVISPYTKRGALVSNFYNQTSMLHTMLRILGVPPLGQMDASSPLMTACFTNKPDFRPYTALTPEAALDELNPVRSAVAPSLRKWVDASLKLDLSLPDKCPEDVLNRILWHGVRGNTPYPSKFAGAHGRGLNKRKLKIVEDDDDDALPHKG